MRHLGQVVPSLVLQDDSLMQTQVSSRELTAECSSSESSSDSGAEDQPQEHSKELCLDLLARSGKAD